MVANRRLQDQQRHEDTFIVQEGEGVMMMAAVKRSANARA
jgi:hypothetical protein